MRISAASVPPMPGWLLLWAMLLAAAMPVQDLRGQTFSYAGSLQFATGNYIFEDRTSSVNLSNGLSLSAGRLNASFNLPLIFQSTPWVSYGGVGVLPTGGPQHGRVGSGGQGSGHGPGGGGGHGRGNMYLDTEQMQPIALPDTVSYTEVGFGDPTVNGGLLLLEESGRRPAFRLNGSAKLPIADVDRGFGTGAWDGGLGAGLSKRLGMNMVFIDAMYWRMGDLDSLQIDNTLSYSLAVGRVLQLGRWAAMASLAGMTPLIPDVDPPLHLGFNVMHWPGRRGGLNAGLQIGLTEASSDVAFSLGWSVQL